MIVIADASPLNYLIQIDCDKLPQALYERVLVPDEVIKELSHPAAPAKVKDWISATPPWIDVQTIDCPSDRSLASLDPGERAAIQLAEQQGADLLLIDEKKAGQKRFGVASAP